MASELSAERFIHHLENLRSPKQAAKHQRTIKLEEGELFWGVRMGQIFDLAKEFTSMPIDEIENLLEQPVHEIKVGAVSIMDFQARSKKTSEDQKKALFDLYIRRHDRINNWDLVDRSAPYVVGGYLHDKPRDILYQLARSDNVWERRTAIVSTYFFIRQGDVDDTFRIAEILVNDEHDLIHKAVGGWVRAAGQKDKEKLLQFLNQYAAVMPRTLLRYAIEHLEPSQRTLYLNMKNS
jgi:3-methyladenine DNA glycosylase AlkD